MPSTTSTPEPIPEPAGARKPPRRLWLFAPYAFLVLLALGYGGYWVVASRQLAASLDARTEALRGRGYVVQMDQRRIEGFPFRLKLTLTGVRLTSPTGWGFAAPALGAESYLHQPGHWVMAAPQGLDIQRPQGGALSVRGEALRASVVATAQSPWRVVLQGTKLVFAPAPGAKPFSLAGAERLELYLRPSPTAGEGMTLLILQGGKAAVGTTLYAIAEQGVVSATVQARITHPDGFRGASWPESVRAWTVAGGVLNQVQGTATAGAASAKATTGVLGVDGDGRLTGAIPLELHRAAPALTALARQKALDEGAAGSAAEVAAARAQGEASMLNLVFQAGAATLGPVRIGPAPRVG